jgi:enediyne biosynthesis protein E4
VSISRRALLALLAGSPLFSQGVASRQVAPRPRGKPSGLPFPAQFVDIAKQAGLQQPTIYGPVDHKDYIVETVGCGCAFIDYDNDGWMDIFVLSGERVSGTPEGTSNRL